MAKRELGGEEWSAIVFLADRTDRPGAAKRLLELLAQGPLSPSEAADRLAVPRPLVSMVVKDLERVEALAPSGQPRGRPRLLQLSAGSVVATAQHVRRRISEQLGLRPSELVEVKLPRVLWDAVSLAAAAKGIRPEALAMRALLQHLAAEAGPAIAASDTQKPVQLDLEDAIAAKASRTA